MLTPHFWEIVDNLLLFAAVPISLWGFIYFKKKRSAVLRIAGQTFSAITASLFGLILLLLILGKLMGCDGDGPSAAIYSPDHTKAVFLESDDEGATGGGTGADLYSHHGLSTISIYYGGWKTIQEKDVHWLSNSELKIEYKSDAPPVMCQSSKTVKVTCEPAQ
jgi:hypothetical protein